MAAVFCCGNVFAQVPDIKYPGSYTFEVNTPITPIVPVLDGTIPGIPKGTTTLAGTGNSGATNGDKNTATFNAPDGGATDMAGNLFVADADNNLIRRITPSGDVTTFAGSGSAGKNDGKGTAASFNKPRGIAIDAQNNLYVADSENNLIRKITPDGDVTTIAGDGTVGYKNDYGTAAKFNHPFGMALDASGNLYVSDSDNNCIRKIAPDMQVTTLVGDPAKGRDDGRGQAARFNRPTGIYIGVGQVIYVADTDNNLIRLVDPSGVVSTVGGTGRAGYANGPIANATFDHPSAVVQDRHGHIYVADQGNNAIRELTLANVTTVAGTTIRGSDNGENLSASFNAPGGLMLDLYTNLYVSDTRNNKIRLVSFGSFRDFFPGLPPGLNVNPVTGVISGTPIAVIGQKPYIIAGYSATGVSYVSVSIEIKRSSNQNLNAPNISYETPKKYVINNAIPTLSPDISRGGTIPGIAAGTTTYAGTGTKGADNGDRQSATFDAPGGITIDKAGNLYIADEQNNKIRQITPAGQVKTYAGSGEIGKDNGSPNIASFNVPCNVVADDLGNLYVADTFNNMIRKIEPDGTVSSFAGTGIAGFADGDGTTAQFFRPYGIAIDRFGNLFIADTYNNRIRKIDVATRKVTTFAGGAQGNTDGNGTGARFFSPSALAFDRDGYLYVADSDNNLIRKINTAGDVVRLAGSGAAGKENGVANNASFNYPSGIVVDASNSVYVADQKNNLIRRVEYDGFVSTVAGTGLQGSRNGNNLQATFYSPNGILIDKYGNLYIGDTNNRLIRYISFGSYKINKELPPGLIFDTATGNITGTPTQLWPPTDYFVTATNAYGTGSTVVNIEVVLPSADLPQISYQTPQVYIVDEAISPLAPIKNSGTATSYAIDKTLPAGLTFNTTTGVISGKPTTPSPVTEYKITPINAAGNGPAATLTISVESNMTLTFPPLQVKNICDVDFAPGASSVNQIFYTSSNPLVATIVAGKIHITGPGTTIITANDGNPPPIQQTLTVNSIDKPTLTIGTNANLQCDGRDVTYTAVPVGAGNNPTYQWYVNDVAANETRGSFTINTLKNGDKVTAVVTNNSTCVPLSSDPSNAITVIIEPLTTTSVTISSNITGPVCGATPVTFRATAQNTQEIPIFQWQINGNASGSNSATFTTSGLMDGDVITCTINSGGLCIVNPFAVSNAITVAVLPESECVVKIPNTFTPNADGYNDTWTITGLSKAPNCVVNVYNRYGTIVYQSTGYSKPWDGTSSGSAIPSGTYYYMIDQRNGRPRLAGSITILR
ncbi:hypothetical protein GCM10023149_12030 [Mucilaginibacter gynuensis]|uniref:Gliding motility-associated-like protein n=1 Tax=Mucilaginibacter gynuensis TaxID=1302236 RepID=A0ABP8G1N5_9SPHI